DKNKTETLETPFDLDESISSFVNPAPVKSQDPTCHRTTSAAEERKETWRKQVVARLPGVPLEPRAKPRLLGSHRIPGFARGGMSAYHRDNDWQQDCLHYPTRTATILGNSCRPSPTL
ncbi:hypothetical protein K0M31_006389, partial [Melipona bicolor]